MKTRVRQDAILRVLRRKGTSTINELAEEICVSKRTVLRDIAALREQGFTIFSEAGRGGGVQLDPQSIQMSSRLTVAEVFALIVCVESLRAIQSLPFADTANIGLSKIEKTLSGDKVRDLRRLLSSLFIGQLSPQQDISNLGSVDDSLLHVFETAFLNKINIQFSYKDAKGTVSRRSVEPQAMLILPPIWYLVAWDLDRNDFRHFRMDRITDPHLLKGEQFRRRHIPFENDVCPYSDQSR